MSENHLRLLNFPWNLDVKHFEWKVSMSVYGAVPFEVLFNELSVYELLGHVMKNDALPDAKIFPNRDSLTENIDELMGSLEADSLSGETIAYFSARDANDSWGKDGRLANATAAVHNAGLLLPHQGVQYAGKDFRGVARFFDPDSAGWQQLRRKSYTSLYTETKPAYSRELLEHIHLGKQLGIIKMPAMLPGKDGKLVILGENGKVCNCSSGADDYISETGYCHLILRECVAASDCE